MPSSSQSHQKPSHNPLSTTTTDTQTTTLTPTSPPPPPSNNDATPSPTSSHTLDFPTHSNNPNPNPTQQPTHTLTTHQILHLFPHGRPTWSHQHTSALHSSTRTRTDIGTRTTSLRQLHAQHSPELDRRGRLVRSRAGVPEVNYHNWTLWCAYLSALNQMVEAATRHANWLMILEREYERVKGVWDRFWDVYERREREREREREKEKEKEEMGDGVGMREVREGEESGDADGDDNDDDEMASILAELSEHNRKRMFLHEKILAGNESHEMRAFWGEGEPEWTEW